jgi:UDP-glucose:(heptosyl)LPS alpha-1,3-glucosyltransferase
MHIVLIIKSLVVSRGGAERFTCNLIRGLAARGHRLTVCCHEWDTVAESFGVDLVPIHQPRPGRHPWYEFTRNVRRALDHIESPDIIFGLTQVFPQDVHRLGGGIYAYWYKRKYGTLFPLQLMRGRVRRSLAFERTMYRTEHLRYAITISELDRRILIETLDFPPDRVHTVYNGFDFNEFHPRGRADARASLCEQFGISPRTTLILFAANNYVRKGLPQGIAALLNAADPASYSLIVIGKSRSPVKRRLQKKIGTTFQSVWLDHVKNPADFYRGADVLLFPTLYDSFANVIGESLLCGLPVITTAQAGGAEMVLHGENGFVVSDADAIHEMALCLDLCRDTSRMQSFSSRAPEKVSSLSIEYCAERTEQVLLKAYRDKMSND